MCTPSQRFRTKIKHSSTGRFKPVYAPILVCAYLLFCLFTFLFLQGNMGDWIAFMHGEASIALFVIYCLVGVVGISLLLLFKKELRILDATRKVLAVSFLLAIIIGSSAFTYQNFSATQENYDWMHDGLLYQQMGQSFLLNREFIVDGLYTHHFGPIYPLYLSAFYVFLPVHLGTQVAIEVIFALSAVVVFASTKKLYGTTPAL